jgi:xylose dehydrogenase (NAD/NADP)
MAERIAWGIVSTAMINDVVIEAINSSARSALVAVASRDIKRAKSYASERSIPRAYGSYEELLEDREVDVVYISVPNSLHCEWILKACEREKHVLCEKPIVTSLDDFDRVASTVEKSGRVLFEAFMYLHHPQTVKVLELIRSGKLGEIRFIDSWFDYYLPRDDKKNIRLKKELDGGSLWDVGVYPNSLTVTAAGAGAPKEVYAVARHEDGEVDTSAYGYMQFSGGCFSQFSVSMRTPSRVGAYIVGEDGYLFIDHPWKPGLDGKPTQVVFVSPQKEKETYTFPGISPYLSEVEAMERCVIEGAEPVVPLSLSRDCLVSMISLQESARNGATMKVK